MGCSNGKENAAVKFPKGEAQLFGVFPSMNCMGAYMLVVDANMGELVPTMPGEGTQTPEFLAMNPYHAVPCLKDGEVVVAESTAILRYLATKYGNRIGPDLYPNAAPGWVARSALIDWAMDRFASVHYKDVMACIYPLLGFAPAPADQEAAGKQAVVNMNTFASVFLKEKFIGGRDKPSIADYKVAPFFFAFAHPNVKEKSKVDVPERILQFNADFAKASAASKLMSFEEGGNSIKQLLDGEQQDVKMLTAAKDFVGRGLKEVSLPSLVAVYGKKPLALFGLTVSMNCAGPFMLGKHGKVAVQVDCMPGKAAEQKAGPFGAIPAMAVLPEEGAQAGSEGEFVLAESNAILRTLARLAIAKEKADPSLYPATNAAKQAHIDWAMDRFSFGLYNDCIKTIYVALGFIEAPKNPAELKAAGKVAVANLAQFGDVFLKETFIGGDKPSIADFKVAPFFAAYGHERLQTMCGIELPARIKKFNDDFAKAVEASALLSSAPEGASVLETLTAKSAARERAPTGVEEAMRDQMQAVAILKGSEEPVIELPPAQDSTVLETETKQSSFLSCCG